jgi:hypothetical protein
MQIKKNVAITIEKWVRTAIFEALILNRSRERV